MLKSKITRENLKDIGAEFLFENKCQPYADLLLQANIWQVKELEKMPLLKLE